MKRSLQDYLGRPQSENARPDVVGQPVSRAVADVASFLHDTRAMREDSDAELVREFADFLAGPEASPSQMQMRPDPAFKERLRRRLWRLQLLMQQPSLHDPH